MIPSTRLPLSRTGQLETNHITLTTVKLTILEDTSCSFMLDDNTRQWVPPPPQNTAPNIMFRLNFNVSVINHLQDDRGRMVCRTYTCRCTGQIQIPLKKLLSSSTYSTYSNQAHQKKNEKGRKSNDKHANHNNNTQMNQTTSSKYENAIQLYLSRQGHIC